MRNLREQNGELEYIPAALNPSQNPEIEQLVREAISTNRNILAIPLNTGNRHWTILIINLFERNFFYYDPMQAMTSVEGAGRMRMQINRIIDELSRDLELTELNFTHSVQKNGWECGFNNLALLKKYLENSKSKRHSIKETDTNEVLEILKNLMRRFF